LALLRYPGCALTDLAAVLERLLAAQGP